MLDLKAPAGRAAGTVPASPSLTRVSPCSVYSGHQSILIPPSELEANPALWLLAVSQYKVRDTFCSYSVMELCTKGLGSQTESLKVRCPHPAPETGTFSGSEDSCVPGHGGGQRG